MLRCSIHIGSVICNLPHRSIEVKFNKYMLLRRSIPLLNLYILFIINIIELTTPEATVRIR